MYKFISTVLKGSSKAQANKVRRKTAKIFGVDLDTIPTIKAYKKKRNQK